MFWEPVCPNVASQRLPYLDLGVGSKDNRACTWSMPQRQTHLHKFIRRIHLHMVQRRAHLQMVLRRAHLHRVPRQTDLHILGLHYRRRRGRSRRRLRLPLLPRRRRARVRLCRRRRTLAVEAVLHCRQLLCRRRSNAAALVVRCRESVRQAAVGIGRGCLRIRCAPCRLCGGDLGKGVGSGGRHLLFEAAT